MDKEANDVSMMLSMHPVAEQFFQLRAGMLAQPLQAELGEELPQWDATTPPDDTMTEMEGLARNPNATGAYAGSF